MVSKRISLLAVIGVLFGVYCFVLGESGVLERVRLEDEKRVIAARIVRLEEEHRRLQELYEAYRSGGSSRDDAIRAGFIGAGERIIFLRQLPGSTAAQGAPDVSRRLSIELRHLKILWALVSVTVIALFFLKKREGNPEE
ncbi:MAG TPA: hypothetical protein PKY31_11850 [Spirochaetota bacterium]|nr:hypothetical protein [Spirochaetota bacterium]